MKNNAVASRWISIATVRAFTLIELLVVIAIIGVLASIVLASLSSAKKKGGDARVISDVLQLRVAFEGDRSPTDFRNSFNPTGTNAAAITSTSANGPATISSLLNDASANGATGYTGSSTIEQSGNSIGGCTTAGSNCEIVVVVNGTSNGTSWTTATTQYAIWGRQSSGSWFCVDSTGATKSNSAVGTLASTNYICS
jgi:prepilin-type N-terminal cleavage/methylation domain-containing protein